MGVASWTATDGRANTTAPLSNTTTTDRRTEYRRMVHLPSILSATHLVAVRMASPGPSFNGRTPLVAERSAAMAKPGRPTFGNSPQGVGTQSLPGGMRSILLIGCGISTGGYPAKPRCCSIMSARAKRRSWRGSYCDVLASANAPSPRLSGNGMGMRVTSTCCRSVTSRVTIRRGQRWLGGHRRGGPAENGPSHQRGWRHATAHQDETEHRRGNAEDDQEIVGTVHCWNGVWHDA